MRWKEQPPDALWLALWAVLGVLIVVCHAAVRG